MLCSVHLFLTHFGYKRRKKKGMQNYKLRAENILKRYRYVQIMIYMKQYVTRSIVYVD